MDYAEPPADTEIRNIIEKLAQFVARNGPEFEEITKNNQKSNPRFRFLYGGEFYDYYQYRLITEKHNYANNRMEEPNKNHVNHAPSQAVHNIPIWENQCPTQPTHVPLPNAQPIPQQQPPLPPGPVLTVEMIVHQQEALKEEIRQSETNLNARHTILLQQQQTEIDYFIARNEMDTVDDKANKMCLKLTEFDTYLAPILDTCTKDSISNGKSWILQNCQNDQDKSECLANYLLNKVVQGSVPFNHKLHLIYLVNDVLHHCARKNAEHLKKALERVVVPMFCSASLGPDNTEEQTGKLKKLLNLWQSKANYFDEESLKSLNQPDVTFENFKTDLLHKHGPNLLPITQKFSTVIDSYQTQHKNFVAHATQQILMLDRQKQMLESNSATQPFENGNVLPPPSHVFPDFSKPPPGFPSLPPKQILTEDLIPKAKYYDLPAGLMIPLITSYDHKYKSLNPKDLRLPHPVPASERLIAALEAFYSPPSHDRPRDSDGWERLGLYEFFKMKNAAKKEREEQDESRSPSPVVVPKKHKFSKKISRSTSPSRQYINPRRRYKSQSPEESVEPHSERPLSPTLTTPAPMVVNTTNIPSLLSLNIQRPPGFIERDSQSRSRSRTRSKSRSRSRSRSNYRSRSRSRSRSQSRSRYSSRSRSNSRSRSGSRSRSISRSRSRSHSVSPDVSTPVVKGDVVKKVSISLNEKELDDTNKGKQILKKMGWSSGTGLGVYEQGINKPIIVTEKKDAFKINESDNSVSDDLFANFRRNKGAAFIHRMRARAEEKEMLKIQMQRL